MNPNSIAILGSGFGLYGYLPALVDGCGQNVVLPSRYRQRFEERPELQGFVKNIQWEDEDAIFASVKGLVIALRPSDHYRIIPQLLKASNIERLIIEKPLAHSPEFAQEVFSKLTDSDKAFRIGYTFRYTHWGKELLSAIKTISSDDVISIDWQFMAHHFRHNLLNWKRSNEEGGGVIRFYGIHMIALLAELGYETVNTSNTSGLSANEIEKWTAMFTGPELPTFKVRIDSNSAINRFSVEHTSDISQVPIQTYANQTDPFAVSYANKPGAPDSRIPLLTALCQSLWNNDDVYGWYDSTIKLWLEIEKKTKFQII